MILLAIICFCLLLVIPVLYLIIKYYAEWIDEKTDTADKWMENYLTLVRWMELKQKGITLKKYFMDNHYQNVAIYGMKEIGELLYWELTQEGVNILYTIDKNADAMSKEFAVIKPTDPLPETDVIVVTVSHFFDEIYEELRKKTKADIVMVEDVLWSVS